MINKPFFHKCRVARKETKIKKILVAIDGSASAVKAVETATELSSEHNIYRGEAVIQAKSENATMMNLTSGKFNIIIKERATQEEIDAWLEETEKRSPVTDNVRSDTTISVTGKRDF